MWLICLFSLKMKIVFVCLLLSKILFLSSTASVVVREYNKVDFRHYESFSSFSKEFITYENNIAFGKNVLLGVASEGCMDQLESPAFRGAQRFGSNSLLVATIREDEWPLPLDQCAEIIMYKFNSTVMTPTARTSSLTLDHLSLTSWISSLMITPITFINKFDRKIVVYWHGK
jgi:hypothetical protein